MAAGLTDLAGTAAALLGAGAVLPVRSAFCEEAGLDFSGRAVLLLGVFLGARTLSMALTGAVATGRRLFVTAPRTPGSPPGVVEREARLFPDAFPWADELPLPEAPPAFEESLWPEDLP